MYTLSNKLDPQLILPFLLSKRRKVIYWGGYRVRTDSLRYLVFYKSKTKKCALCNRKITYCLLQRHESQNSSSAHFNFFSEEGTLFTKDHIVPKSMGGTNRLTNLQTMCVSCNGKKGNGTEIKKSNGLVLLSG